MLCSYRFGEVWLHQGVGNVDLFIYTLRQRITDIAQQTWLADLSENSKLGYYRNYKIDFVLENYLSISMYWKHRVALARFRCANHKLGIEQYR